MDEEVGVRVLGAHRVDVGRADARMDVALTVPDMELGAQLLLDVGAEPHVGPKRIGVSGPWVSRTCWTTCTAFALVQQ